MNAKDHIKLLIATGMAALSMVTLLSVCGCSSSSRGNSYSERAQELGVSTADYINTVTYWDKVLS